jgi:hypothetical protein
VASVNELESQIKDLEQSIKSRSGGSAASRRGNDGLLPLGANKYLQNFTQEKINTAKAENNQAALENEQRIYRDLISEQLAQERAIAERQQQLASLQQELELAKSNQAQTNSAAGQTAEQKVNNDTPRQQQAKVHRHRQLLILNR